MGVSGCASENGFYSVIQSPALTVVDAMATWCGPCRALAPQLDALSSKYPDVKFTKFDVDSLQEVATRFGISAMPTILFFRNGRELERVVGADVRKIEAAIIRHK